MSILNNELTIKRIYKNISYTSQNYQNDFDPQVDLHIGEYLIPKVILDFGSQVNILTKNTWEKLGRPRVVKLDYYLMLANKGLTEPMGLYKNVEIVIMGIPTLTEFKVIEPKEGRKSYLALVSQRWERKMKANISLEKDRIKFKGQGKKVIIPLDTKERKPW